MAINLRDSENTSLFADIGIDKLFEAGFIGGGRVVDKFMVANVFACGKTIGTLGFFISHDSGRTNQPDIGA